MTKITESHIEKLAIELLEKQGFAYIYAPDIAPDSENPLRVGFDEVILGEKLKSAIERINPSISAEARADALRQVQRIHSPQTIVANENFQRMLTEGVNVVVRVAGEDRGDFVKLIDFSNPENNDFCVVNQFTISQNHQTKRPDIILFVNGLPLVVIELKNPVDENATIKSAFRQIQTYKEIIPSLFTYNTMLIISDGLEAKVGTISSGFNRFMAWKTCDGKVEESHLISQLETLIKGMLNKKVLLDLVQNFIIFEKSKKEDSKTGVTSVETIKKLAAYHQYYAVNKAVESVSLSL